MKTTTVRRGNRVYEYVTLVEAVRDGNRVRHDVIARLGEASALRASGELDRIINALAAHAGRPAPGEVTVESSLSAGVIAVVDAYWRRLGLDTHFAEAAGDRTFPVADAVFAMIANRLADPCSKRALPEWADTDVTMPARGTRPVGQGARPDSATGMARSWAIASAVVTSPVNRVPWPSR